MSSENRALEKSRSLVKNAFREYYFKYSRFVENPDHMEQHEFGYVPFGSGMIRHLSFRNFGDLIANLIREVPADVYCSNAYYRFPTYPMQEKQWLGADLIFDIDAKDLDLPCEPSHSYFICTKCKEVSVVRSDLCESCKSGTLNQNSIPCHRCISALKKEVRRLLAVLTDELGIDEKHMSVYFSGNNGFHIFVSDEAIRPLSNQARSDLVSYLVGSSLMTDSIGVRKVNSSNGSEFRVKFPKSGISYGWRKAVAAKLGIDQSSVVKLTHIVQRKGGYEGFKSELANITKSLGIRIDPQVTMDVHRIFRMSGTINSKSGLTKMRCHDIETFDPLTNSCLLGSKNVEVRVKVSSSQLNFTLKGESFKVREQILKLPLFAAVYLICKGLAEVTPNL